MFLELRKNGDDEGEGKEKEERPKRNLDHVTCNDYGLVTVNYPIKPISKRMGVIK